VPASTPGLDMPISNLSGKTFLNGLLAAESTNRTEQVRQLPREAEGSYWLDPLRDSRWSRLLERHPLATVFHTTEWLEALRRTYGYQPVVLTTTPADCELRNGWAFCDVKSWLTGRRLVSLPFSDHCDPLLENEADLPALRNSLAQQFLSGKWKSIQARPRNILLNAGIGAPDFVESHTYFLHTIDLRRNLDEIYGRFHKNSIERKIRRAEHEHLTYDEGRSEELIQRFYGLLLLTRRRHRIPPQPLEWFRNLVNCMDEKAKVRVCFKDGRAVAAILTLKHKDSMVYKYGCSDARCHNLGGMPFLFWKAIRDAKQSGTLEFDLGRSDCDNQGLAAFKEHLGGMRSFLTYWTYPGGASPRYSASWKMRVSKRLFRWMPSRLLGTVGKLLYRHIG
jgi:Acetyltransferase (GNAT) domain